MEKEYVSEDMAEKRLSEMSAGEKGRLTRIGGSGALRRRIMDMGIVREVQR
ncbi:MAG: FeoA domain-containing protein [Halobacteriota archaeon]